MRAFTNEAIAAEKAAEQAKRDAAEAQTQAAIDQIADTAFDDHPAVIDARQRASDAADALRRAKAARKKLDSNTAPKRIATLQAETQTRSDALKAAELESVIKGADIEVLRRERAAIRDLSDELAVLESGWEQFQATITEPTSDADLAELTEATAAAEIRIEQTIHALKRDRVTGVEERAKARAELVALARSNTAPDPIGKNETGRRMAARREATKAAHPQPQPVA